MTFFNKSCKSRINCPGYFWITESEPSSSSITMPFNVLESVNINNELMTYTKSMR